MELPSEPSLPPASAWPAIPDGLNPRSPLLHSPDILSARPLERRDSPQRSASPQRGASPQRLPKGLPLPSRPSKSPLRENSGELGDLLRQNSEPQLKDLEAMDVVQAFLDSKSPSSITPSRACSASDYNRDASLSEHGGSSVLSENFGDGGASEHGDASSVSELEGGRAFSEPTERPISPRSHGDASEPEDFHTSFSGPLQSSTRGVTSSIPSRGLDYHRYSPDSHKFSRTSSLQADIMIAPRQSTWARSPPWETDQSSTGSLSLISPADNKSSLESSSSAPSPTNTRRSAVRSTSQQSGIAAWALSHSGSSRAAKAMITSAANASTTNAGSHTGVGAFRSTSGVMSPGVHSMGVMRATTLSGYASSNHGATNSYRTMSSVGSPSSNAPSPAAHRVSSSHQGDERSRGEAQLEVCAKRLEEASLKLSSKLKLMRQDGTAADSLLSSSAEKKALHRERDLHSLVKAVMEAKERLLVASHLAAPSLAFRGAVHSLGLATQVLQELQELYAAQSRRRGHELHEVRRRCVDLSTKYAQCEHDRSAATNALKALERRTTRTSERERRVAPSSSILGPTDGLLGESKRRTSSSVDAAGKAIMGWLKGIRKEKPVEKEV